MGCDSSYLERTGSERAFQKAAQLLIYARHRLGLKIEPWMYEAANTYYCEERRSVPELCKLISELDETLLNKVVYNAHSKTSRDLANWWEKHLQADRERIEQEQLELKNKELRRTALLKLSKEELKALGIKER